MQLTAFGFAQTINQAHINHVYSVIIVALYCCFVWELHIKKKRAKAHIRNKTTMFNQNITLKEVLMCVLLKWIFNPSLKLYFLETKRAIAYLRQVPNIDISMLDAFSHMSLSNIMIK